MLILQQGRISSSTQGERNPHFGFCQSSISCTRQCDSVGIILSVSDQSVCIPPRTLPTTPFPIHHHPSTSPLQINHNPPRRIPRLILSIHNTRIHRQRRLPLPEPLPHPPLQTPGYGFSIHSILNARCTASFFLRAPLFPSIAFLSSSLAASFSLTFQSTTSIPLPS